MLLPTEYACGKEDRLKLAQKTKKKAAATKKPKKKKSFKIGSTGESDRNGSFAGRIGKVAYFLCLGKEKGRVLGTAEGDWLVAEKLLIE